MWESSPRRFHTGFLLSALTFRVPGEGLIPAQILLFVLSSPFPPRGFSSEAAMLLLLEPQVCDEAFGLENTPGHTLSLRSSPWSSNSFALRHVSS